MNVDIMFNKFNDLFNELINQKQKEYIDQKNINYLLRD